MSAKPRTIVVGVGNLLRRDDGAGIHVVQLLKENAPWIDTNEAGLACMEILEAIKGYDCAVIVDAIQSGGAPGTVYNVDLTRGEKPPAIGSSHGVDLLTTLRLGEQLYAGELPADIRLIAVEAEDIMTLSESCTPAVEEAVKRVSDHIIRLLR